MPNILYVCLICLRFRKSLKVDVDTLKKTTHTEKPTNERINNTHGNTSVERGNENMHTSADFIELKKLHGRHDEEYPRTRKPKNIHHTVTSRSLRQSRPKKLVNKWSRKLFDKAKLGREGLLHLILLC